MKKSKWDIIGSDIDKFSTQEWQDYFYYWYDGEYDDSYCDNCGAYYCSGYSHCQDYDYLDQLGENVTYLSKSFGNWTSWRSKYPLHGRYIDMMSIYSKSVLRQRKIDFLLGEKKWEYIQKPTLGDLMKKNNLNNEN